MKTRNSIRKYLSTKKAKLCLLLLLPVLAIQGYSQGTGFLERNPEFLNIATPNAASFNKFIDHPVSLYDGTPDVSIPLYTVKDGSIDLPIVLRYNTSGIKTDEEASWVGLGWNLNVGGIITQYTVGGYDDNDSGYSDLLQALGSAVNNSSAPYNNISLTSGSYTTVFNYTGNPKTSGKMNPDVFYFSYPGGSGKFFIDNRNDSVYFVKKESDIKVERIKGKDSYNLNQLNEIKLTTAEGIVHRFVKYYSTATLYDNYFMTNSQITSPLSIHFLLTESLYPDGSKVTYTYNCYPIRRFAKNYYSHAPYAPVLTNFQTTTVNYDDLRCKIAETEFYLSFIETPNYTVGFYTGNADDFYNAKKLTSIRILRKPSQTDDPLFVFTYDYFVGKSNVWENSANIFATDLPWDAKYGTNRLKLTSVYQSNSSGSEKINEYKFTYDPTQLPNKYSYSADYWGYYNGINGKSNLPDLERLFWSDMNSLTSNQQNLIKVLLHNNMYGVYEKNRGFDFDYCKAGILTGIEYPTKGYTEFTYEPNTFSGNYLPKAQDVLSGAFPSILESQGCGLRIKSIKSYENNTKTTVLLNTEYEYANPSTNKTSGILHDKLSYCEFYQARYCIKNFYYDSGRGCTGNGYSFSDQNVANIGSFNKMSNPYGTINGVGYTYVKEKRTGTGSAGYIIHEFYNQSPSIAQNNVRIDDPKNGYEIFTRYYDQNNAPVRTEENNYTTTVLRRYFGFYVTDYLDMFPDIYTPNYAYMGCYDYIASSAGDYSFVQPATAYTWRFQVLGHQLNSSYIQLNSKTVTEDGVTSQEFYTYNPGTLQLTSKKILKSDGNYLEYKYSYPTDYAFTPYTNMTAAHVLSPVIEEKIFNNNKYTGGNLTKYKSAIQGSQTIYVKDKKYFSAISAPLSTAPATFTSSGENVAVYPLANIKFENQTAYGKPQTITYNDADRIVYLWGYNYQYPIAEIKGVPYTDVISKVTEATLNAIAAKNEPSATDFTTINGLRNSLTNARVTTYEYKPLAGMTKMTDPRGVVTIYDYDAFGRLIKVTQAGKVIESYDYHYKN